MITFWVSLGQLLRCLWLKDFSEERLWYVNTWISCYSVSPWYGSQLSLAYNADSSTFIDKNFIKTTCLVDSNQSKAMHCARLIFSCWYTLMFWKGKTTNMSITIGLPKLGLRQILLPTEDTTNIMILVFVLFFILCRDKLIVLCSRLLMKLGK